MFRARIFRGNFGSGSKWAGHWAQGLAMGRALGQPMAQAENTDFPQVFPAFLYAGGPAAAPPEARRAAQLGPGGRPTQQEPFAGRSREKHVIWFEMASENSIWGMDTWIWLQISIRIHS